MRKTGWYTAWCKKNLIGCWESTRCHYRPIYSCQQLWQMLSSFQTSLSFRTSSKSVRKSILKIPPHLKPCHVLHYLVKFGCFWLTLADGTVFYCITLRHFAAVIEVSGKDFSEEFLTAWRADIALLVSLNVTRMIKPISDRSCATVSWSL